MVLATVFLVACKGPVGNKGVREGEFPEKERSMDATSSAPVGTEAETGSGLSLETSAVPGIYFLHDFPAWPPDRGVVGCTFIKEHLAGRTDVSNAVLKDLGEGAGAVLELADQARNLGGNVVLLPHFSNEFAEGVLTGHLYRCDTDSRKRLHAQGAAEHRLTVVE